jgi:hypothetical protein
MNTAGVLINAGVLFGYFRGQIRADGFFVGYNLFTCLVVACMSSFGLMTAAIFKVRGELQVQLEVQVQVQPDASQSRQMHHCRAVCSCAALCSWYCLQYTR